MFVKRVCYVTTDNKLRNGTRLAQKYRALQLKRWKISYITTENLVCLVFIEKVYIDQSTKGWCPDQSRCNNVLISFETDFDPQKWNFCVSFLLPFGSKTLNLGFLGFLAVFLT